MAKEAKKGAILSAEEKMQAALVPLSEQPYFTPQNWLWVILGNAVGLKRGASPRPIKQFITEDDSGVNWIKICDTDSGKYVSAVKEKITPLGAKKSVYVEKGTLLPSNSMSFGRPYILNVDGCIHDGWLAITPSACFDKEYLYYALLTSNWYFEQVSVGTAVRNLNSDRVAATPISMPPIAEQQRIVDRIESIFAKLDEAKEKAQAVVDGYELRKSALLHKAFTGELIGLDNNATVPLSTIVDTIRIGPFGSALHKEDYVVGGIPVVNPKHISNQKITAEESVSITKEKAEELSAYWLKQGDIVMGRRGEMGRSAPVSEKEAGWLCGTGSLIIRLQNGYDASFYSQIIASHSSVQYLEENCVGSTK